MSAHEQHKKGLKFQKNLVVWKRISITGDIDKDNFVSEELSSVETGHISIY